MKPTLLVLTCAAIALIGVACTETTTPTNTNTATATSPAAPTPAASVDEFARARTNFATHCEGCHGPNAEGGLAKVENKQIKVPSLKAAHAVKHTDEELINIVTNGEEAMPAFKDKLQPAEITELVSFVRKNFQAK